MHTQSCQVTFPFYLWLLGSAKPNLEAVCNNLTKSYNMQYCALSFIFSVSSSLISLTIFILFYTLYFLSVSSNSFLEQSRLWK